MTQAMDSFPFLHLPRELRDCIYGHVLQSTAEPPTSPEDPMLSDRHDFDQTYDRRRGIMFEQRPLAPVTCCGLLCTNRQISREMHDSISRHGVVWKLDCMIQNHHLWPTWLSLPASPTYLRHVEVNMRIFNYSKSQWGADGGPGIMVILLLRLLGGFFEYGPRFLGQPLESPLQLDSLIVSLIPLPETPGKKEDPNPSWRHPNPGTIHSIFASQLSRVQRSGVLSGRVKTLKLCSKGSIDKELKITDRGEDAIWNEREWAGYVWAPGLRLRE